jgi:CBS-domain-containing membrane protein
MPPTLPRLALIAAGAVGGGIAIAVMWLASDVTRLPIEMIPFATSIVLVLGSPEAEPAQPRPLVCGHLIATVIGLIVVKLAGPSVWSAAAAVGLAMVAMHLARSFHPPAGIDPLVVVHNDLSWGFLLMPVAAGALLLAAFAYAWHNTLRRGSWPQRWW